MQHYTDVNEFLLSKLKVKREDLKILTSKWPSILRVHPKKLNTLITMLHQNGVTSTEIIQMGGLLFYFNLETIQRRIEILNEKNMTVKIPTLKLSEKLFDEYVIIT